jgi:hypothetical protein
MSASNERSGSSSAVDRDLEWLQEWKNLGARLYYLNADADQQRDIRSLNRFEAAVQKINEQELQDIRGWILQAAESRESTPTLPHAVEVTWLGIWSLLGEKLRGLESDGCDDDAKQEPRIRDRKTLKDALERISKPALSEIRKILLDAVNR